ncbi:hypothetical protein BLGI_1 [Brevibacillus laterosporus GI-9]|nr:hypothetical protein BLGI_1 [Brevibacillus laterosporus GI-9]
MEVVDKTFVVVVHMVASGQTDIVVAAVDKTALPSAEMDLEVVGQKE